jgi:hypothetical protein
LLCWDPRPSEPNGSQPCMGLPDPFSARAPTPQSLPSPSSTGLLDRHSTRPPYCRPPQEGSKSA